MVLPPYFEQNVGFYHHLTIFYFYFFYAEKEYFPKTRGTLRVNKHVERNFSSKNGVKYANMHVLMEKMAFV